MFKRILIANRGEIACRIMHTARQLGIECVAIYSRADQHAKHVQMADQAFCVGPAPSKDSYLQTATIIKLAQQKQVDAIHPGYGFLSENAEFAEQCQQAGIVFIGPSASAIAAVGNKDAAKRIMQQANVPVIPGYHGERQDHSSLITAAQEIGFPLLIKAVAGGGGKGMRLVTRLDQLEPAITAAKREAKSSFGNDNIIIEKYLEQPRHVEVQIFGDTHGNYVHLFTRDCSIQRRHQKIIEEAPAPGLSLALQHKMGAAAIAVAKAINYYNAGTVEFLLDQEQRFYFMEMNTRLQVEHPVTEKITQQDLVAWQLHIAAGAPLPLTQEQITIHGHAIETRIYAEDPWHEFLPSTGELFYVRTPTNSKHIRIDSGVQQGDNISIHYDPMIAKLITWGNDRQQAIQYMQQALKHYHLAGIQHNIDFLRKIINLEAFQHAQLHTHFIQQHHACLFTTCDHALSTALALTALFILLRQNQHTPLTTMTTNHAHHDSPWHNKQAWRMNLAAQQILHLQYQEQLFDVTATHLGADYFQLQIKQEKIMIYGSLVHNTLTALFDNQQIQINIFQHEHAFYLFGLEQNWKIVLHNPLDDYITEQQSAHAFSAPMPGTIISILTKPGSEVAQGDSLLVIEAMKMEHTIVAPSAGTVKEIYFKEGDQVHEGTDLLAFEPH
ncbi:MAG: acetyl/propionyl/methylcrotonyl-CoA carboxylase subunit alpha [Gammaproteobacteria bacterium]